MDVRDRTWVRGLADHRGFSFADLSTPRELAYDLGGTLGPAGNDRPWTCSVVRSFLDDGGAETRVRWSCPSLLASSPEAELEVSFGGAGGGGAGDGAALATAVLLGLARGRGRARGGDGERRVAGDVLAGSDVRDPSGVLSGRALDLFLHWPVLDPPPQWVRSLRRVAGARELPPDAPPEGISLGMAGRTPLGVVTRDWWQLAPRLEHQIDLGIALGHAVVAAGRHA